MQVCTVSLTNILLGVQMHVRSYRDKVFFLKLVHSQESSSSSALIIYIIYLFKMYTFSQCTSLDGSHAIKNNTSQKVFPLFLPIVFRP